MTDQSTLPVPPELFMETVAQAPVAISITDEQANILYVNRSFTDITGYAPEECLGRNESMLSDQRTPKEVYRDLWTTIRSKRIWQGMLINRHKQGTPYLAHVTISPILDERGEITHFIGMHRDLTTLYHLERRVSNQKVLIESVVDFMPLATVLLDENDRVILDNQMYKTLISDLAEKEPSQLFLRILREDFGEEWARLQANGLSFRNREVRIERGQGAATRWYACSGTWFNHGDDKVDSFFQEERHTYLLLTLNDITHQKRQEEMQRINALRALLAEEEKIESLRETLLGAIHHIESPLNQLAAASTLMLRRGTSQSNGALLDILQQIIEVGTQSVDHLKTCIPSIHQQAATLVSINQLLHETVVLLTDALLAGGIVVDWQPNPTLPSLIGIEYRLRAMFKHLIENAIEAMNQSGIRRRELRLSTWADSKLVHICIEDTGPGIAENLRVKVFEPFFSTKNGGRRRHTGMGLTMAQEVINQHHGLIRIDAFYHDGCRMLIQLPIHRNREEPLPLYAHG